MNEQRAKEIQDAIVGAASRLGEGSRAREILAKIIAGGVATFEHANELAALLTLSHHWDREHVAPVYQAIMAIVEHVEAAHAAPAANPPHAESQRPAVLESLIRTPRA